MVESGSGQRWLVTGTSTLAGLGMLVGGFWSLLAPDSFARFVRFPANDHFLHDLGAFQLGAGVALLLALIWADALATALTGFLVTNVVHTSNHFRDTDLGGSAWQTWSLAALSVLVALALAVRLRQLGYVVGQVGTAASPALAGFVRQKTVRLTTYRRDGRPGSTPVSIVVEGEHAYLRSFERSIKTRRLRHNPTVEVAPSTALGKPAGTETHATMRRVTGAEARHAARLLARKYPLLHGVLVPLTHRLARRKTGRTVHFVLTPVEAATEQSITVASGSETN